MLHPMKSFVLVGKGNPTDAALQLSPPALPCKLPMNLANGKVRSRSVLFGSNVTYKCNDEYQLVGQPSQCTVPCNAKGCTLSKSKPTSVFFGSNITFSCNTGYKLVGEATRQCNTSCTSTTCTFSGSRPKCEGKRSKLI